MLQVEVSSSISPAFGGVSSISIDAKTINELMGKLADRYPRFNDHFDQGIAVSINGQIYRDNWQVEIPQDSEVYLLPRLQGG